MFAFFIGLLIGGIVGLLAICILVAGRVSQAEYDLAVAQCDLLKMEKMLRFCLAEADYLSEIGIFAATRTTGLRIVKMKEVIEKTLKQCGCNVGDTMLHGNMSSTNDDEK
jgi:hypothetical protein